MLRGGSWNNNQDNARAAYRNRNHPDNRNNNIGFRVVCSSHAFTYLQRRGFVLPIRCGPIHWVYQHGYELPVLSVDHGLRTEAKI